MNFSDFLGDMLLILGSATAFYGLYLIYQPLAFVVLGLELALIGLAMGRAKTYNGVNDDR